ncbi:hypothetical protein [Deinococcus roseus]|uniref:Uncharacterized protein n=1 Tax=Deinococcus roseus TaxID=392414 RepID=A0ABQ2DIW2_9DEIO|nr:hypothetical protein [Deinococcus roseus]GGJ56365.1 hypothetical protein GCM10008938_48170 [Deinococcus roseus]
MQEISDLLNRFVKSDFKDEATQDQAIALCMEIIEGYFKSKAKLYN